MASIKQLAILGLAALMGCDAVSPENEARVKIADSQVAAASKDEAGREQAKSLLTEVAAAEGVSTASIARAKAVLGQVEYEAALELLHQLERKELAASRIALQIASLGAQLSNSAALVEAYKLREPNKIKTDLEAKIAEAKGGPDKPKWLAEASIASLSAAEQEVSRIQGEITKRQTEIKDLETQRVAALEEAEAQMKVSEAAQGRESVDAYNAASNSRKKAADLQARIDLLQGQLMPLEKELGVAVGQRQIIEGAIQEFTNASREISDGWAKVQSQIAAQTELIKQIATATDASAQPADPPSAAGLSIAGKAEVLKATIKDAETLRQAAAEKLGGAIAAFNEAATAANQANMEMSQLANVQPAAGSVLNVVKAAIGQEYHKLKLAAAERTMAEMYLSKAAGVSARIKLLEMLTPIMERAGQQVPEDLKDDTLASQLDAALKEAGSRYEDALAHLTDVIDTNSGEDAKKAASIARIFVLYGREQLARIQGNEQQAQQMHAEAVNAVKAAANLQVRFPPLPGDLATAIPVRKPETPEATEGAAPAEGAAPTEEAAPPAEAPADPA